MTDYWYTTDGGIIKQTPSEFIEIKERSINTTFGLYPDDLLMKPATEQEFKTRLIDVIGNFIKEHY